MSDDQHEEPPPVHNWVVVTGSSSGIGQATALALAADGWNVIVHYAKNQAGAEDTRKRIADLNRHSLVIQADLVDPAGCEHLVEHAFAAIAQTGGKLSAWVQAAGADTLTGVQAKWSFADKLDLLTRVDLWGTIHVTRAVGRRLAQQGGGCLVTIGWDQAMTGMEGDSGELFAAIKGGIMCFTRSLAVSLAPTVRVNCVAPGWIKTAWGETASTTWQQRVISETPLQRWGEPRDIAAAVVFLLGPGAAFWTGQTLYVNGGVVRQ